MFYRPVLNRRVNTWKVDKSTVEPSFVLWCRIIRLISPTIELVAKHRRTVDADIRHRLRHADIRHQAVEWTIETAIVIEDVTTIDVLLIRRRHEAIVEDHRRTPRRADDRDRAEAMLLNHRKKKNDVIHVPVRVNRNND